MPRELLMMQNSFEWVAIEGQTLEIENAIRSRVRDLKIEGQTYQNLIDFTTQESTQGITFDQENSIINFIGTLDRIILGLKNFKPNTKYTLITNVLNIPSDPNSPIRINDDGTNYNYNILNCLCTSLGINKVTFTTPSDISNLKLILYNNDRNVDYKFTFPIIIEGDFTNTDLPILINGIESVAERESKNLFKDEGWSNKHLNNSNNTLRCSNNFRLPVKLNDVYTINYEANNPNLCLVVNGFKADGSYFIAGLNTDWLYKNQMPYSFKITNPEVKSIGFMLRYKNDETISPTSSDVLNSNITVLPNLYTEGDVNVKGTSVWLKTVKYVTVKPNTKYRISADIESISKGDSDYPPCIEFYSNINTNSNFFKRIYQKSEFYLTTREDTSQLMILCSANGATESTTICEANFKNMAVTEADLYPIKLTNKGKNLLNISTFKPISYNTIQTSKDGNVITVKGLRTTDVEAYTDAKAGNIKVYLEEDKTYSASFKSDGNFGVKNGEDTVEIFFMLDGTTKHYFNVAGQRTVTIPKGYGGNYYVRFDVNSGDKTHKFWDIQVEEGDTVTDYEPYREPTLTEIPLPQPLRSLPNGVCDEVVGNKLVQRVGKVILSDISTSISLQYTASSDKFRWIIYTDKSIKNKTNTITTINNRYPDVASTWGNEVLVDGLAQGTINNSLFLYLDRYSDGTEASKQALIAEIANNPVTVYYELAEPIIHDLTIPSIYTEKGTNIITTANNIKPNLYIKYKKSKK